MGKDPDDSIIEMINAINSFHLPVRSKPSYIGKAIFLSTVDTSVGSQPHMFLMGKWIAVARILAFNLTELLKFCLKVRPPYFMSLQVVDVTYPGTTHVNLNNGTAVVLDREQVHKFYFKDTGFFADVYGRIADEFNLQVITCNGFLVIKQLRHKPIKGNVQDAKLLISTRSKLTVLDSILGASTLNRELFSVAYKVRQLFRFYDSAETEAKTYLAVCAVLEQKCAQYGSVICHGDLWKGNILTDVSGQITLVDFDKVVRFCPAYDVVYFYLMSKVLPNSPDIARAIDRIEQIAQTAATFLEVECRGEAGRFREGEIRLCVFTFAFLKLLERDLRHDQLGNSLSILNPILCYL